MSSGIHNHITGYHNRRSIRLRDHDYSQPGYYFITVCIEQPKKRLFGNVIDGRMLLNDAGKCTERCWRDIPAHFPQVKLDEFVVMPNHVHGIIVIRDSAENHMVTGTNIVAAGETDTHPTVSIRGTSNTIGSMVRGFKIGVSKWFRENTGTSAVWQRNYYDRVIRDEQSLLRIRKYIRNNPRNWQTCDRHLDGELVDEFPSVNA